MGSIPGLERNPMVRGAQRATVHGAATSWTQLKLLSTHTQPLPCPTWPRPPASAPAHLSRSAKPHLPLVAWTHTGLLPLEVVEELLFALGLVHVRWLLLSGLLGHFGSLMGTVVSHGRAGHHWGPQPMLPLPCPLAGGPPALALSQGPHCDLMG